MICSEIPLNLKKKILELDPPPRVINCRSATIIYYSFKINLQVIFSSHVSLNHLCTTCMFIFSGSTLHFAPVLSLYFRFFSEFTLVLKFDIMSASRTTFQSYLDLLLYFSHLWIHPCIVVWYVRGTCLSRLSYTVFIWIPTGSADHLFQHKSSWSYHWLG